MVRYSLINVPKTQKGTSKYILLYGHLFAIKSCSLLSKVEKIPRVLWGSKSSCDMFLEMYGLFFCGLRFHTNFPNVPELH